MDAISLHLHLSSRTLDLLEEAERSTSVFRRLSSVNCPSGCGDCCRDDRPHESILAVLPAVSAAWQTDELDAVLESAASCPEGRCVFYDPDNLLHCRIYSLRPLICRLFGYAARLNKYGQIQFRTCFRLRQFTGILEPAPPLYFEYYSRLESLYPPLGTVYLPINRAFVQAGEWLLFRRRYFPRGIPEPPKTGPKAPKKRRAARCTA